MPIVPTSQKARELIEFIHKSGLKAPRTIIFGKGRLNELGELAFPLAAGKHALLVLGGESARRAGLDERIRALLERYTLAVDILDGINREPTVSLVDQLAAHAREIKPALVVSAGGGSVVDAGKAVSALATNEGSVEEFLEGLPGVRGLAAAPLPHIAIPTVAGTGSEMTRNAVIGSPEKQFKRSMRADAMLPSVALVDSLLTVGCPADVTASSGMDTIAQLIECCISLKRRPQTSQLACEGLRLVRSALPVCVDAPANEASRDRMMLASMLGGVCLANSGLGMAHGIAAALGALFGVPHGLACGILLPHALRYNHGECAKELSYAMAAFLNQDHPTPATVDDGLAALETLAAQIGIPPDLKTMNLTPADVERIAEQSMGTSMSANPIPMTPENVQVFLEPLV